MTVISKFETINNSCANYAHPWSASCMETAAGLFINSIPVSLRIYVTAYALTLIMKGKIPTRKDIKYIILGIIQSTAFLSCHALVYPLALCSLRRIFGNYNFLTVSFIPSFIASLCGIMVERPSRRGLLSLYVTNVASDTLFRMAVSRKWVRPVQYGEVFIFSLSSIILLYLYRSSDNNTDAVYSLLRFFVGPYEKYGFRQESIDDRPSILDQGMKHRLCLHPKSCLHYTMESSIKLFGIGCGLQICLKLLLQMNRIMKKPKLALQSIFQLDSLRIGAFFAGFGGLFRVVSCGLRHARNDDSTLHAIPAGLVAGLAFFFFRDNTAALYTMWKTLQILYNIGLDKGHVPPFHGATILFYCLATATLFHAALLEPHSLRPSYWRFLKNLSGNRISEMDRECLNIFGVESSRSLQIAQGLLPRQ